VAKSKKKKFIKRLKNKYRLIVVNDETLHESASVVLKPLNVFILFSTFAVIFTTLIVLLLFYTPLKEYVPGFDKTDYIKMKLEQDAKFDSLERVNKQYFEKWKTIDKILRDDLEGISSEDSTSNTP
jgi:hypothetical protein